MKNKPTKSDIVLGVIGIIVLYCFFVGYCLLVYLVWEGEQDMSGKGDKTRQRKIGYETYAKNWTLIFKKN